MPKHPVILNVEKNPFNRGMIVVTGRDLSLFKHPVIPTRSEESVKLRDTGKTFYNGRHLGRPLQPHHF